MIFQASLSVSNFVSQLLGLWLAVLALIILVSLIAVRRDTNKDLQVYKLFLYVAGLNFVYILASTLVHHHSIRYYHKASEASNYISTNTETMIAIIATAILYGLYTMVLAKVNRRDLVSLMLLGTFSLVAVFVALFDTLA